MDNMTILMLQRSALKSAEKLLAWYTIVYDARMPYMTLQQRHCSAGLCVAAIHILGEYEARIFLDQIAKQRKTHIGYHWAPPAYLSEHLDTATIHEQCIKPRIEMLKEFIAYVQKQITLSGEPLIPTEDAKDAGSTLE